MIAHINNRLQKKQNNFGVKYGNEKGITEMINGLIKLEEFDEGSSKETRDHAKINV